MTIRSKIRPAASEKLKEKCAARGVTEAEAVRQGLALWMEKG